MTILSPDELREDIRRRIRDRYDGCQAAAAREWGISRTYLNLVLRFNRDMGPHAARRAGYRVAFVRGRA